MRPGMQGEIRVCGLGDTLHCITRVQRGTQRTTQMPFVWCVRKGGREEGTKGLCHTTNGPWPQTIGSMAPVAR